MDIGVLLEDVQNCQNVHCLLIIIYPAQHVFLKFTSHIGRAKGFDEVGIGKVEIGLAVKQLADSGPIGIQVIPVLMGMHLDIAALFVQTKYHFRYKGSRTDSLHTT